MHILYFLYWIIIYILINYNINFTQNQSQAVLITDIEQYNS
jgi:hypothetical protein